MCHCHCHGAKETRVLDTLSSGGKKKPIPCQPFFSRCLPHPTPSLDSSVLKLLLRYAAWTFTTCHVGSDSMTAHERIRSRGFKQQIVPFGKQILFKAHKTAGPLQILIVNCLEGCWLGFNTRTREHVVSNNEQRCREHLCSCGDVLRSLVEFMSVRASQSLGHSDVQVFFILVDRVNPPLLKNSRRGVCWQSALVLSLGVHFLVADVHHILHSFFVAVVSSLVRTDVSSILLTQAESN